MWSDRADEAYKRLTRTITVPDEGASCPSGRATPRARLRLYDRRGAHRRPGRLDDAPRPQRTHVERPEQRRGMPERLEQPGRPGQRAAPVPHALPDVRPDNRPVPPDRDDGRVARRQRQLVRLAAVADRPGRVRRRAGRGVDHGAERLGLAAVPGCLRRRHRDFDRRGQPVVRGRRRSNRRWAITGAPQDLGGSRDRTRNDSVRRGGLGTEGDATVSGTQIGATSRRARATTAWTSAARRRRSLRTSPCETAISGPRRPLACPTAAATRRAATASRCSASESPALDHSCAGGQLDELWCGAPLWLSRRLRSRRVPTPSFR